MITKTVYLDTDASLGGVFLGVISEQPDGKVRFTYTNIRGEHTYATFRSEDHVKLWLMARAAKLEIRG